MSSASSKRLTNLPIPLFQSFRIFQTLLESCFEKNEKFPFTSVPKLPRKCLSPDYSIINHFSSSNKQSNAYYPITARNYYRVLYYDPLDSLIASLKERFDQPCFKAYGSLESLLLKSLSNESIANEFEYVKCAYKGDLDVDQPVA